MNNQPAVTPFFFQDAEIRTIAIENNPWFVVKDVCDTLGLDNVTNALIRVPEHHLTLIRLMSGGQMREMKIVDEPGLYRLILRSDKPQAEPFMEWVTGEVLPSIRKTGSYGVPDGMTIVPAAEIMELYRDTKSLLIENNTLLKQQLAEAQAKIPQRKNFTPDEDAQVIRLHQEGLSHREIGLAIDRKPSSVRSCLRRLKRAGIYGAVAGNEEGPKLVPPRLHRVEGE